MLNDEQLQSVYVWVDSIPLSRPKRNIARDFSDGVLVAEIVKHYHPKLIDLHNYSSANGISQKTYNWQTLCDKVFPKLGYRINKTEIQEIVGCKSGAIEKSLLGLRDALSKFSAKRMSSSGSDITHRNSPRRKPKQPSFNRQQQQSVGSPLTQSALGTPNNSIINKNCQMPDEYNGNRAQHLQKNIPINNSRRENIKKPNAGINDSDETIHELRETVDILQLKIQKLEQLVRLKDNKIAALLSALNENGN